MGSFYPPASDPYFRDIPNQSVWLLKNFLAYLRLDGRIVLSASMRFYESPPWSIELGGNHTTFTEFERKFDGTISHECFLMTGPVLAILQLTAELGILRYKIEFPHNYRHCQRPSPFLGVGRKGDGNLIFAEAGHGAGYHVAMDDWGFGTQEGKPLAVTGGEHDLEIIIGPMLAKKPIPDSWRKAGDPRVAFLGRIAGSSTMDG